MKKLFLKLSVLVMVLTLVTLPLVSGTYAKYATSVTASDSVAVATWNAKFDGDATTVGYETTFDLFQTWTLGGDSGVEGDLLAPGTTGGFAVNYHTSGTEVARNVAVTMNTSSLAGLEYLKFYTDAACTDEILGVNTATPTQGNLLYARFDSTAAGEGTGKLYGDASSTIAQNGTLNIYWKWVFDAGVYTAVTSDPGDMTSNFSKYYTESSGVYTQVAAPVAYAASTYYTSTSTHDAADTLDGETPLTAAPISIIFTANQLNGTDDVTTLTTTTP